MLGVGVGGSYSVGDVSRAPLALQAKVGAWCKSEGRLGGFLAPEAGGATLMITIVIITIVMISIVMYYC